jgi:hypothetical protein
MAKKADSTSRRKSPKFSTSGAMLRHLRRHEHRVVLSGAISQLQGSDQHVAFSPNGFDWLAIPVDRIEDAKLINRTSAGSDVLNNVQLTLSPPTTAESNLLSQLISLHQAQSSRLEVSPPSSPPPVCPNGVARWVVDHWECV